MWIIKNSWFKNLGTVLTNPRPQGSWADDRITNHHSANSNLTKLKGTTLGEGTFWANLFQVKFNERSAWWGLGWLICLVGLLLQWGRGARDWLRPSALVILGSSYLGRGGGTVQFGFRHLAFRVYSVGWVRTEVHRPRSSRSWPGW